MFDLSQKHQIPSTKQKPSKMREGDWQNTKNVQIPKVATAQFLHRCELSYLKSKVS